MVAGFNLYICLEKKNIFTYNRFRKPKKSAIWFLRESSREEDRE